MDEAQGSMMNINIETKRKLFIVEFGKPVAGGGGYYSRNDFLEPVYVIASDYQDAAQKGLAYANLKIENRPVVDDEGSLNNNNEQVQIKTVRLACDEFVI